LLGANMASAPGSTQYKGSYYLARCGCGCPVLTAPAQAPALVRVTFIVPPYASVTWTQRERTVSNVDNASLAKTHPKTHNRGMSGSLRMTSSGVWAKTWPRGWASDEARGSGRDSALEAKIRVARRGGWPLDKLSTRLSTRLSGLTPQLTSTDPN
jgi:hypothetical protein